ncbi:MAG: hypothetical protein OXN21_11930 [Chloroflexota bacterium]|nr:hypothetical protein [Chloroflexota bacterium]
MRRADGKRTSTRITGSPKRLSTAYTAEQRDRIQRGVRILARMIVRAHLRREASRAEPSPQEPPTDNRPDN